MKKINLKTVVKNVENQLFDLASHLICSICQELFNKSVTTPCGHSFCNGCIKRVLSSKDNTGCPLCKNFVKRYYLEIDNVKSTLSEICRELPNAFEKDVEDLSNVFDESFEDMIKLSKLAQLYNQESVNDSKKKNSKIILKSIKNKEENVVENDSEVSLPVLKRSKNVLEYAGAKRKRMDDLVSISQTEAASNSTFCESSDIDKKLQKIEKIPPEEKVKEWFDTIGDNIFINSPNSSFESLQTGNTDDKIWEENKIPKKGTMIRRDYHKPFSRKSNHSKENVINDLNALKDPYEFIPSQPNPLLRKKRGKKGCRKEKKIPEFRALQNFTKESVKRSMFLLNETKEPKEELEMEVLETDNGLSDRNNEITASQKFDKLLIESKENEKKTPKAHILYAASQASSPKLLDCSFHSKIETAQQNKTNNSKKNASHISSDTEMSTSEESPNVDLFRDFVPEKKRKKNPKRKRSLEPFRSNPSKKRLTCTFKINEIQETDGGIVSGSEGYLSQPTKLLQLLSELLNDKMIFGGAKLEISSTGLEKSNPDGEKSVSVEQSNNKSQENELVPCKTQNNGLVGFCTQEMSLTTEIQFKEMVAKMEKELNLEIFNSNFNDGAKGDVNKNKKYQEVEKLRSSGGVDTNKQTSRTGNAVASICSSTNSLVPFNLVGKIKKDKIYFVNFLLLGRLTPSTKRSRSSVVKLVFPIGLSSFSRKRPSLNKFEVGVQTSQNSKVPNQASEGIQTSPNTESLALQTSPRDTLSVEVQTTQHVSGHNQNPNSFHKSIEIQTSQMPRESVEVQTSQSEGIVVVDNDGGKEKEGNSPGGVYNETQIDVSIEDIKERIHENVSLKCKNGYEVEIEAKKSFSVHKKIVARNSVEVDEVPVLEVSSQSPKPGKNSEPLEMLSLEISEPEQHKADVDLEIESDFDNSWVKNSQLVELKNRKNKQKNECTEVDDESNDSDVLPLRKHKTQYRILSEDSCSPVKCTETPQVIPLNPPKNFSADQCEIINLESSNSKESQYSEEQMLRVLKNIDLDLAKVGNNKRSQRGSEENNVKGEESDSDFFVEQTPPRQTYSKFVEPGPKSPKKALKKDAEQQGNSEGTDFIADSIPKGFTDSESFLMLSAPEKVVLTPKKLESEDRNEAKRNSTDVSRMNSLKKVQSGWKTIESDQSQTKGGKAKETVNGSWTSPEHITKTNNNLCVVASGVNNSEMIKKFVQKFKMEFSNKPTKNMTHLIVGLHENDEGEVLPLCTPKLLFALANKKWIVSELWAETCLKRGRILPEEEFETLDPIGSQGCRAARLSSDQLLGNCEIYLLGNFQTMNKEEFADLIKDCGGTIVPQPEKFSRSPSKIRMIVADRDCLNMDEKQLQELHERYSTVILSRDVIIMSIQSYKLANFTPYLLHLASEGDLLRLGYPSFLVKNEEEDEVGRF